MNNQGQIAAGVRAAVAALALVFAAALFLPAADSLTQVLAGAFGTLSALVGRFALAGLLFGLPDAASPTIASTLSSRNCSDR